VCLPLGFFLLLDFTPDFPPRLPHSGKSVNDGPGDPPEETRADAPSSLCALSAAEVRRGAGQTRKQFALNLETGPPPALSCCLPFDSQALRTLLRNIPTRPHHDQPSEGPGSVRLFKFVKYQCQKLWDVPEVLGGLGNLFSPTTKGHPGFSPKVSRLPNWPLLAPES